MKLNIFERLLKIEVGYAHCDVPCGIYDPYPAQIDAHTCLRMTGLLKNLEANDPLRDVKFSRYIENNEKHAEDLKNKVRVIYGDFLTPGKVENDDELVLLVRDILKEASNQRQNPNEVNALKLVDSVNKFSEIFWKVKGVATKKVASPYPTNGDMVIPL